MEFDVNFNNKPIIKETQAMHDGGAGNLGYFEQEDQKKKKDRDKSVFNEAKEHDTFEKHDDINYDDDDFSISKLIAQIILSIKDWIKKVFKV
ncbi:MAG: hypothetical protein WCG95_06625 [bacterium]